MSDLTPRHAGRGAAAGPPEEPGRPPAPDARGESALGTGPATGDPRGTGATPPPSGAPSDPAPGTDAAADAPRPGPDSGQAAVPDRAAGSAAAGDGTRLLGGEECDRLGQRLQHAVAGFVDAPRSSVEEADRVLEEIASRFTDAVARRRRTLRTAWQGSPAGEEGPVTSADTEQLRLALRDYRELADRLLHL